jgi:hypothetical protein
MKQNTNRRGFIGKVAVTVGALVPLTTQAATIEPVTQSEIECAIIDFGTFGEPCALVFRGRRLFIVDGQGVKPCSTGQSLEWYIKQDTADDRDGSWSHAPSFHRWLRMLLSS